MRKRPIPVLLLLLVVIAIAACSASARVKTLRTSLVTVNAARDELSALRADRDRDFIARAAAAKSHEELDKLEAEVAAFRWKRDLAFGSILATYVILGAAVKLDDDSSFREALAAVSEVVKAVADLKGKP